MGLSQSILNDADRKKLDGIIQKMETNGEPEESIRFVVDDFKSKYGVKKNGGGSESASAVPSTSKNRNGLSAQQQSSIRDFMGAFGATGGKAPSAQDIS